MTGAAARTLRPVDARRVERILRRLGARWESRALAGIDVVPNARLRKTLGRLVGRPWRIELGPRALVSSKALREVVTHEAAHAATRDGAEHQPPHGPQWRALMARAGYPKARGARWRCHREAAGRPQTEHQPKPKDAPPTLYDHWCPGLPVQPSGPAAGQGLAVRRLRRRRPRRSARDHEAGAQAGPKTMTTPADCPFCFPAGDRIAFEDRLTRALWDAFPVSEGHLLIVPRRHVPTWFDPTASTSASTSAKPQARPSSTCTSTSFRATAATSPTHGAAPATSFPARAATPPRPMARVASKTPDGRK
jgi:predicted SprT family Zn-dependent metalloprotease